MKLDRTEHPQGRGKYALVNLRTGLGVNDCGEGEEHEFFVIMLKDINAEAALLGYANEAAKTDPEFAEEVRNLAARAGQNSPNCQIPD